MGQSGKHWDKVKKTGICCARAKLFYGLRIFMTHSDCGGNNIKKNIISIEKKFSFGRTAWTAFGLNVFEFMRI